MKPTIGSDAPARAFVPCADLIADQARYFWQQDGGNQHRDDPRIDPGEPIGGDALRAEWPERGDSVGLTRIHGQVQKSREQNYAYEMCRREIPTGADFADRTRDKQRLESR